MTTNCATWNNGISGNISVHEDEYNRYQQSLKSLEQRMRAIEEAREHLNRRNDELQFDHQVNYMYIHYTHFKTKQKQSSDEIY